MHVECAARKRWNKEEENDLAPRPTSSFICQLRLSIPYQFFSSFSHCRLLLVYTASLSLLISPLSLCFVLFRVASFYDASIFVRQLPRGCFSSISLSPRLVPARVCALHAFLALSIHPCPATKASIAPSWSDPHPRGPSLHQHILSDPSITRFSRSLSVSSSVSAGRNISRPSRLLCYFSPTSVHGRYARAQQ